MLQRQQVVLVVATAAVVGVMFFMFSNFHAIRNSLADMTYQENRLLQQQVHIAQTPVQSAKAVVHVPKNLDQAEKTREYRNITKEDWESLVKLIIKFPLDHYWGSHATTMLAAVTVTAGPIYELGMGLFSTPTLHNIAVLQNRFVLSCETNKEWLNKFLKFNNSAVHRLYHVNIKGPNGVNEWDKYGNDREWGVVFVDQGQSLRRRVDIGRFMDKTDLMIVHDTQDGGYHYEPYVKKLNFTFTDTKLATWTMVASRRDKKLVDQAAQLIKWTHEMPGAHPKAG